LSLSKLADIFTEPFGTRLTLFCTVAECTSLFYTINGNFFYNLTLACTSLEDTAVEAVVFFDQRTDVPELRRPGDVVFICNGIVQKYKEEINLKIPINRGSGFAFFDPASDSAQPYAQIGVLYDLTPPSKDILKLAKEFALLWRTENSDFYVSEKERRLEEIVLADRDAVDRMEPLELIDISCNVLRSDLMSDPKMLWVWDGTDVRPDELRRDDTLNGERFGNAFVNLCQSVQLPEPSEGEEPLPSLGTVVPVAILNERRWKHEPKGWIKLRNVTCIRYKHQMIILYGEDTRWAKVPQIPGIHERYLNRLERNLVAMHVDGAAVMSHVAGHPCAHVTLRSVCASLNQAIQQGVTFKKEYRCLVYLKSIENYGSISMMIRNGERDFDLRITLQDATGQINATLFGKHGWKFFGLDQAQIGQELDESVVQRVQELLVRALTENDPVPWLDVCLRVMYREQRVIVQILDTAMIQQ